MSTATASQQRLEGAPVEFLEPATRPTLAEAQAWCKALANSHYENFHVATYFLPAKLRPHFHAVYAYCRVSDDLGDEVPDRATATRLLDTWGAMLNECYDAPEQSRHPVFVALRPSIVECDLPRKPFLDLLCAFQADQVKTRFATLQEDNDYSRDSANPVGSLVLYLCGYRDPAMHALSDKTCTALQLANFWQDVGEDLRERDRVYLPQDRLAKHGLDDDFLKRGVENDAYCAMVRELCAETRAMLLEGAPLIDQVDRELAATLRLFTQGGLAILDAIAAIDYNTLSRRIEVSKSAKMKLLAGAALSKLGVHRGSRGLR
ncbi:squalene synthase HpnC [Terriglobus roseus]|uniref:Squalene synthase HpnC n=1 Tax=Terriglobus roseus TaxID=392734 RepID=A0A1H4ITD3_9BACT|nr:squalene synthase HpnC [Terriglobus roseus]SEB36906.1 squalene synthase HpnC [Terriglobus roseus]